MQTNQNLSQYAQSHNLQGFCKHTLSALQSGRYDMDRVEAFRKFYQRIENELLNHPIIQHNAYCEWFQRGQFDQQQLRDFIVQFSVFSNQFLVAQLHKMLNAESIEEMRASKEILANEIGVIFSGEKPSDVKDKDIEGDPEMVSIDGSVDGGKFRFRAAHFEWLLRIGAQLELEFNDMGKRKHGWDSTLFFCDELIRLYGSDYYHTAAAASYAVENWAAAGFWDQLVDGLIKFKSTINMPHLPIAFFTWHSRIEANHAQHTKDELEEHYFTHTVDEDLFIKDGNEMLDGVKVFWDGLDKSRDN
jgi:pyrroloquinoline quinone (PQQ) biosynthesis protein C